MSRITLSPHSSEFLQSSTWINSNYPKNGLFRVYWKDVNSRNNGGATLDPDESNCKIHTDCSGHLRWEWFYKDGQKDGVSKGWWPSGQLKSKRSWNMGRKDGKWTTWHHKGKLTVVKYFDGNSNKVGTHTKWYPNGQIREESIYGSLPDENGRRWFMHIKYDEQIGEKISEKRIEIHGFRESESR